MGASIPTTNTKKASASPDLLRAFLWVFLIILVLLAVSQFVYLYNRQNEIFAFDSSRVDSVQLPGWAPALWKKQAEQVLAVGAVSSIFEKEVLTDTENKIAALPFVEKVDHVSRSFPRSVNAKISVRRPVALVQVAQKFYAIDTHGVLLPGIPEQSGGGFAFPLPTVVLPKDRALKLPSSGNDWSDPWIDEACRLSSEIEAIAEMRLPFHIKTIDLSNLLGRVSKLQSEVVFYTDSGVKIDWGRSSLGSPYGELSPEAKIQGLKKVLIQFPDLKGLREVDLRFDRPTVDPSNK